MKRLIPLFLIAATSLPLLAGCGSSNAVAPIQRGSKTVSKTKAASPVTAQSTTGTAAARPFLTQSGASGPAFSPAGDRLLFESSQGLSLAQPDASQPQLVQGSRADDRAPAWSPDGQAIAFARANGAQGTLLMRLTLASNRLEPLFTSNESIKAMAWAPDGRSIVFATNQGSQSALYRMPVPGNAPVMLWRGAGTQGLTVSGTQVVFDLTSASGGRALARMPLAGGQVEGLTVAGLNPRDPRISASGKSLAYVADDGLYVSQANGAGARRVSAGSGLASPAWNPRLAQVLVAAPHGTRSDLQAIELPLQ